LNQLRCRFQDHIRHEKTRKRGRRHETFMPQLHRLDCKEPTGELELLAFAGSVAAITFQLYGTLCGGAICRAVLFACRHRTETTIHRTLLRICCHDSSGTTVRLYFGITCSTRMQRLSLRMPGLALLSAAFQQMSGVLQARLGQLGPAQHAGYLLGPLRVFHAANLGLRSAALL
jgi:hypothetical protein